MCYRYRITATSVDTGQNYYVGELFMNIHRHVSWLCNYNEYATATSVDRITVHEYL